MATCSSSADSEFEGEYSQVCSFSELQRLGRKRVTLNDRVVVLFHVKGEVYALDHFCYRKPINNHVLLAIGAIIVLEHTLF